MKGQHDRDRAVERLLREARPDVGSSQPCVDAESLAAWSEGTLPAAEVRAIEAHASECARCQSMIAVFARAEPAPLPAEPFWRRWRLQWVVPATAMATALAVWVAVPRDRPPPPAQAAAEFEERATRPTVPPGVGRVDGRTALEAVAPPLTGGAQQRQQGQQGVSRTPRRFDDRAPGSATLRQQEARDAAKKEAAATPSGPPPRSQTGAADAASAPDQVAKAEPTPAEPDQLRQRSAVRPSPAAPSTPPPPVAAPAVEANSAIAGAQSPPMRALVDWLGATSAPVPFEVESPDARHRWRIDPGGQLQHSSSAGSRWQSVALAGSDVLTAGSSPEGSVCWLVGRNGAVWLTTDGLRFGRKPAPAPVDLLSVRATDARHATLVAADGRTFVTADGGVTWTPAAP